MYFKSFLLKKLILINFFNFFKIMKNYNFHFFHFNKNVKFKKMFVFKNIL